MSKIAKIISIAPFGKERPRVTRNGQHTYMSPEYETKKWQLKVLFGEVPPNSLLSLSVIATRKMPKSWSKAKQKDNCGKYCPTKPDLDNIVGAVMDSLIDDDSRVVRLQECTKVWGYDDSLEITLEEVE